MAKPTGAICNLDCEYCFFLAKEELYPGSTFRMGDDVLQAHIRQLLAAHAGQPEVVVTWQGGEPTLMGLDFFARAVELERQHAQPGQRVVNALQTNATLLDDTWAAFLREHDFLVGVSIDGPPVMHDALRVDKGGKPTFDRVIAGLRALQRHGVDWNALTTVNSANGEHGLAVYRFLRDDLAATHVQLIPVVERAGEVVSTHSVAPEQYGRFMVAVFEEWARWDVGEVFVPNFDTALAHWLGLHQAGACVHAETCGGNLALEHTGDLYSCDHFVEPAHLLGTITGGRTMLELVDSPQQRAFGDAKRDTLPGYCRRCDVRFACHGGCPKDRFATTPDGEPGLHHLCAGYQRFFRHIDAPMRVMASLVRAGGEAAGVRAWYAERDAAAGPGAACSCGSGAVLAACHGRPGG
jgi:uncharacterized protein